MSWKQYGGIKNLDSYNNISVNNIIADKFTVRDKFLTEFQIIGETQLLGDVRLGNNSSNLIEIKSDVIADENIDIRGDLNVNGKLIITSSGEGFFLKGTDDNRLGINIENPLAVLDIAGSYESVLNVYSDQSNNRNIIARNYLQNGIAVNVTDDDESSLQFYSGTDVSNNKEFPDSEIKYLNGGILEIITGQDTRILSQVSISADGSKGHIHNETMVVYDISNGTYKKLYYKEDSVYKGNAFSLIAYDSSANTSMNITTPDGKGAVISGGAYPKDTARSMLILDVSNNSEEKPQALMIVSGKNAEKYNTTTSINKYISQTDQYSLDVNGATYISDSQINIQEERNMKFFKVATYGGHTLASGSYDTDTEQLDVYESDDGGVSWGPIPTSTISTENGIFSTNTAVDVKDIFMNDRVRCIITEDATSAMYVSTNVNPDGNGSFGNYESLNLGINSQADTIPCNSVYSFYYNTNNNFVTARNNFIDIFTSESVGNSSIPKPIGFLINDVKGIDNTIYAVGTSGNIKSYTVNTTMNGNSYTNTGNIFTERTDASYNVHTDKTYKKVFVYDINNIIAIGDGIITYTHDGGLTWNNETSVVSDISLNDIHIKSENESIIVGDNGKIYVSHDRYITWTQLNKDYINGSGTSEYLIGDTSNNITSITMTNGNNIITTHALTEDTGRLLLTYAPSVLNRDNMSTLDVIGSLNVSGDLVLHDRGELKTTDVSFGLLKTHTRQIDFGLSGELITIGAVTGLVDMKGRLQVADDVSLNSNLDVQGKTALQGFLDVSNSAHVKVELTVDSSLNVTEIYGINNDIINMSKSLGLVDMKGRLQVADDVSFNSKLDVQGETSLQGFLDVSNSAHINNELTVDGSLNVTEIYGLNNETITMSRPTGLVDMKGRLQVADDVSFNSKVNITDDAILYSNLDVGGNTLITGSLTVDGNLNFRGNLSQTDISHNVMISDQLKVHNIADNEVAIIVQQDTGSSSIAEFKKGESTKVEIKNNGDISMNSVLKIMNNTTSNNNIGSAAGALYVKGGTRLDGSLNVMSGGYFDGKVTFNEGSRSIGETVYTMVTITSDLLNDTELKYDGIPLDTVDKTSKFNINGGANFNDSINVSNTIYGNKINMSGDVSFNSNAFISNNLYLDGDASLNKDLFVSGVTTLGTVNNTDVPLYVDGSGAMRIPVGSTIDRNNLADEIGQIRFNTTDDTFEGYDGAYWGSLGGVSNPEKTTQVYVGDNNEIVFKTGGLIRETIDNTTGDISMNTNLFLGGDASLNSKLFVSGDISANTNFYLGGDASLNSKLFVSGQTKLGTTINNEVPLYVDGSGAMRIPVGSTNDRPTPESGQIRFNTTDDTFEGYDGANWGSLGGVSNPEKTTQVYVGDNNEIVFKTGGLIRETIDNTTGDVSMNTNLFLGGDASLNSNIYLGGDASLNSKLFVNGDISANTNFYLGGDASLNSKLFVSGQTKLGTTINNEVPLYVDGYGAMRIPVGSTNDRPIPESGQMRFNTTDYTFEGYDGENWGSLGGVSNADKSSRVYINDMSAIVFETDSIIRETIDNSGNTSFNVSNNQGYGKINMFQNGTATILEVSDNSNNNHIRIQNQDAFKLIYDQSGNENNRIVFNNNEIEILPYPTNSMLINHNGAMVGDDYELLTQLRDKDWRQIGYINVNGTKLGNAVSISKDGKRLVFGEYAVNSVDASSNVYIYDVFEREIYSLEKIEITGGNVSSIDLNEDGTRIIIGQHNAGTNGQIQYYEETVGSGYSQTGVLKSGSTSDSKLGHTTSINNDGTIFAAGQYTNNSNSINGIEGGVLIFKRFSASSIQLIADISMNNGGAQDQYNQMGRSIELNGAGDRIVIGGTIDNTNNSSLYRVYVYQKQSSGDWNQVLDITNTYSIGINYGISVAMSNDGKVISVATQENLDLIEDGQVLVYDLQGDGLSSDLTHSLRGSPIKLDNIDDGDTFGSSMSLNNDGTVLAIGTGSHNNFNGQASIYKYLNSDWTIIKTIAGTYNSNLGGIHDHDIESGRLVSDEDGICVDGTGDLVIIGAPNLFNADDTPGSGNGKVYLYRNQVYTLGVNKKLRVKGDVVVDNGTLDVSGNIIVGGSSINKIISDQYGIGNHIQSTNIEGRNVFEGGSNYIYSQEMNYNGAEGGHNRLYATQKNGYNYINATGSGGANYIEANVTGYNTLKVDGNDKIVTKASTTTLTNTDIILDGNVGIGTTDPQAKLDVNGNVNIDGDLTVPIIQGVNVSNIHKIRLMSDTDKYSIGMTTENGAKFGGLFYNAMCFTMNNDEQSGFLWRDVGHNINGSQGAMSLTSNGKLTVARNTRIGYGEATTDTPSGDMLDVNGNVNIDGDLDVNGSIATRGGVYQDLIINPSHYKEGVAAAATDFQGLHDVEWIVNGGGTLYISSLDYLRLDTTGGTTDNPSMRLHIKPYAGTFKLPIGWVGTIKTMGSITKTLNNTDSNAIFIYTSSDNTNWNEKAKVNIYGGSGIQDFNLSWQNTTELTEETYVKLTYKAYSVGAGTYIKVHEIRISNIRTIDMVAYEPSKFSVRSNGNVGIGTTDPQAKLDVNGNVVITGELIVGDTIKSYNFKKDWRVDYDKLSTSYFYPIVFENFIYSGNTGELQSIDFEIVGVDLMSYDPYNEQTIKGFFRPGGYGDHHSFYEYTTENFIINEMRMFQIYRGTRGSRSFAVYVRGGYKYKVRTDAENVVFANNSSTVTRVVATTVYDTNIQTVYAKKDGSGNDIGGISVDIAPIDSIPIPADKKVIGSDTVFKKDVTATSVTATSVTATSYNSDKISDENKIRFYGNNEDYAIGLSVGNTFGGLNGQWSMIFKVSSASNDERGFLWKRADNTETQGVMSLTAKGQLNVASNTRIGYGIDSTTLPSGAMLDVNGDVIIDGDLTVNGDVIKSNDNTLNLYSKIDASNSTGYIEMRSTGTKIAGKDIQFRTDTDNTGYGIDRMTIEEGGNVGLGTTNPLSKLAVIGSALFSDNVSIGNNINTTIAHKNEGNWLSIYHNSNNGSVGDLAPNPEGGILFSSPSSASKLTWNHYIGVVKYAALTNPRKSIRMDFGIATEINSVTTETTSTSSYTPHMTVHNNGNVGIGTTDPQAKLDVNGDVKVGGRVTSATGLITMNTNQNFNYNSMGYTRISDFGAGELQSAKPDLHMFGNLLGGHTGGNFVISSTANHTKEGLVFGNTMMAGDGSDATPFNANAFVEHMRINKGGKVGIGTDDPQAKLDVNGNVNINGELTATSTYGTNTIYDSISITSPLAASSWYRICNIKQSSGGTITISEEGSGSHTYARFSFHRLYSQSATLQPENIGSYGSTRTIQKIRLLTTVDALDGYIEMQTGIGQNVLLDIAKLKVTLSESYGSDTPELIGFTTGSIPNGYESLDLNIANVSNGMIRRNGSSIKSWTVTKEGDLTVGGTVTTGNVLQVGTNTNDTTPKTIYFGGTKQDNSYSLCVIENRIYSDTENRELLLFSGNDSSDRIRLKGGNIRFDTYSVATENRTVDTTKMIIDQDGNVGIGTIDPGAKLDVNGNVKALTFNATSDIRVKTNIKSIEPNEALKQINKLEPKTYKFYDSEETHYGLIAQDAEQIIPEAVKTNGTKMIPSICETCKLINDGKTIVLDTKTTTDMVATKLEFDDISGNKQSVEIESFEGDKYIHLKKTIEEHAIKTSDELTIYVHGHEVNDFRSINYNTIVAANVAATKALTTELNETRTELNETRTELNETRTELNETRTELNETRTELNETRTELNETRTELNELKRLVEQLLNK